LQVQITEWESQREHCQQQILDGEDELATSAARSEEARDLAFAAQAGLPEIETRVRDAAAQREEMRIALARVEQSLALAAQTQRDSDRQLQALELRRERLMQELKGVESPDLAALEQLTGDKLSTEELLEEAQGKLVEFEERLPQADAQRNQAQQTALTEAEALARLDARLSALVRLQEDVQ
jgi:chromosome segregation protein